MLDSFCATKQHRIVTYASIADTSSDFAQDDGRGNENYELGLPTVRQFVHGANVLSQLNAREIFRIFSRTLHSADALGVVAQSEMGRPSFAQSAASAVPQLPAPIMTVCFIF